MPLATDEEQALHDAAHEFIEQATSHMMLDAIEGSMHPTMKLLIKVLNSTQDELPKAVNDLYESIHEDAMRLIKEHGLNL